MVKKFDIIAIGGGSGGIATMNRAGEHGAKAAVIEGKLLGGTCVNVGCVPKKIMWHGAQMAEALHYYGPEYGFQAEKVRFDFATLKENRDAYIERSRNSYQGSFQRNHVDFIEGYAKFIDAHTVEVNGEQITADHIVIATGAKPMVPDIPGKELGIVSDDVFAWDELPASIAILGAGYIAIEMAGVLHSLGVQTKLFYRKDQPLRSFEPYVIQALLEEMDRTGLEHEGHKVPKRLDKLDNGLIQITFEDGSSHTAEQILWAIGRQPNLDGLNLEVTGVQLTKDGFIAVDDFQETNVPGIYALGDVTGKIELTPVAIKTGRLLSERLFNGKKEAKMDFNLVPTVIFSHPAIGAVGLTEPQALEQFGAENIKVYTSAFTSMYTALGSHRQMSKFKLITAGPEEKVVGLHGIGFGVDEMIQGFAVAMKMGATKEDFDSVVAIHPTGSEEFVTMR